MSRPCRPSTLSFTALLVASALGGCVIYDGDDDPPCYDGAPEPGWGLRNPQTNECESWGGGGGGCYGDDTPAAGADLALPNWASCPTACEGLDELTCQRTDGCRATYWLDSCPPWADCDALFTPVFDECVGAAPGPVDYESCDGLNAEQCSQDDDCAAVYTSTWEDEAGGGSTFSYCQPEPWVEGCYSDEECPAGYQCTSETDCLPPPGCEDGMDCPAVCYGQCVPVGACATVDCGPGYHCEEQCYGGGGGDGDAPEPSFCEAFCVPDEPTECLDAMCEPGTHCETVCYEECDPSGVCTAWCTSQCVPDVPNGCELIDCAPGYHCEEVCPDCPPDGSDCGGTCSATCVPDGTMNPGECTGDVFCDALPPTCPSGTVPGILDGCWTGFCIPESACGPDDPGQCYLPVACDMAPPSCPAGTTPGVGDNACYTGYCIPEWACGTSASCESLTTEWECAARADCVPLYNGAGCTCYPDGTCECLEWEFERCASGGDTPVEPPMPGL